MPTKTLLFMAAAALVLSGCSKDNPVGPGVVPPPAGMKQITGGTFTMGDTVGDTYSGQPLYSVTLSTFFIDTTEVTQADYRALMGVNPSNHTGDSLLPVEEVTWFDAVLYCNARSRRDALDTVYSYTAVTGTPGNGCTDLAGLAIDMSRQGYRLPTMAEKEYACRAGTTTLFYWGGNYPPYTPADTLLIDSTVIWSHNSGGTPHPVASKKPNGWGLYDMVGNVWEWCNDWYATAYDTTAHIDPPGPSAGTERVNHGGAYHSNGLYHLRSGARIGDTPSNRFNDTGFRCVKRR
jgi:formylglycine-generating enzyme required for sulfatase activity